MVVYEDRHAAIGNCGSLFMEEIIDRNDEIRPIVAQVLDLVNGSRKLSILAKIYSMFKYVGL